jgi:sugar lactone lactonase YvrE
MKYAFLLLPFIALFFSCQSKKKETAPAPKKNLYLVSDFTPDGEFTSGIEGPATDKKGNIYVVNYQKEGTIGMVSPKGKSQLFINLPEGSIGNGIRINQQGHLLVADYKKHQVLAINPITQTIDIYAQNQQMNQPNDLAIMKNGILFASDPNWKASTGNIWRVNKDKTISLLEENMGTTNGIEVSPDEQILYVNQSVQRNIWAYDLSPSGAISNKRLFHQFPDFGMDGMRCDSKGNLYVTRYNKGTIAILSPEGKLLKEVQLKGKKPSNITFGGKDGKTCYITLQDRGCLERFESEFAGREWSW